MTRKIKKYLLPIFLQVLSGGLAAALLTRDNFPRYRSEQTRKAATTKIIICHHHLSLDRPFPNRFSIISTYDVGIGYSPYYKKKIFQASCSLSYNYSLDLAKVRDEVGVASLIMSTYG